MKETFERKGYCVTADCENSMMQVLRYIVAYSLHIFAYLQSSQYTGLTRGGGIHHEYSVEF